MSGVDSSDMARMTARPGMDTRVWLTLAVITELSFDAEHGIFADVQFQPGGDPETALLGGPYAGGEFGMYCPVAVGDTVLVALPMGDPGNGPVIIARMWSAADKPSADFGAGEVPSENVVLRAAPSKKLLIRTSAGGGDIDLTIEGDGNFNLTLEGNGNVAIDARGTGNVVIDARGTGKVFLGGGATLTPLLDGVVTAQGIDPFTGLTYGALGNATAKVLAKKETV